MPSSLQAESAVHGRLKEMWRGSYLFLNTEKEDGGDTAMATDTPTIGVKPCKTSLMFHCVASLEKGKKVWCAIPITWLSTNKNYYLHPDPEYKVSNVSPINWGLKVFKRHSRPESDWEEFDVGQIIHSSKPGKLLRKYSTLFLK